MKQFALFLCFLLPLILQAQPQSLPDLPNYYSGYAESITTVKNFNYTISNLSRSYYDQAKNLVRTDMASELTIPGSSGTLSVIQDVGLKLQYMINRKTRSCITTPLGEVGNYIVGPDGKYFLKDINDLFYLTNTSNYAYNGTETVHGLTLDNWQFVGNFNTSVYEYTNTTVMISVTQEGTAVPSTSSVRTDPTPWRISLEGMLNVPSVGKYNISSVVRVIDPSFEELTYDVFDISDCVDPKDATTLVLAVPKGSASDIDYHRYGDNVRLAVTGYTKLSPMQVGRVQVISDTGLLLYTSMQLSNVSTQANVTDTSVMANAAYKMIVDNAPKGLAPFGIAIAPNVTVTPVLITTKSESLSTLSSIQPTSTIHSTATQTSEPSSSSESIVPTSATSDVPSNTACPTRTEVTVTLSCSVQPTAMPNCPTSSAATSQGVPKPNVVGIALAMLITGSLITIFVLFLIMFICRRWKTKWSYRSEYKRQINIDEE